MWYFPVAFPGEASGNGADLKSDIFVLSHDVNNAIFKRYYDVA